jgi:hypothetical protein
MNRKKSIFKLKHGQEKPKPEITPNKGIPETPPVKPEKRTEPEKGYPYNPSPEVKPIQEPKTYPDKKNNYK